MAKENTMQNSIDPSKNNGIIEKDDWENPAYWNSNEAEYADINAKLDQLNFVLDRLEKENQSIQDEVKELLSQSN